jgi:hypothetical protein
MLDRLFLHHPRSVGESYTEHGRVALGFGLALIRGGLGCLVHAAVPGLCTRTGSDTVRRLHAGLGRREPVEPGQLTYEI